MRAAGAAILGAAVVGAGFLLASSASAAEPEDEGVDFDIDAEIQYATNLYANALTNPEMWSAGQLLSLEGLLVELGMSSPEATNIKDLRIGLYGEGPHTPLPLPDINFIPASAIDEIADRLENEG